MLNISSVGAVMNFVLFGFKGCGKSFAGGLLAARLGWKFVETDCVLEDIYFEKNGKRLSVREIAKKHGMVFFRLLEEEAVQRVSVLDGKVIGCGGGTAFSSENVAALKKNGKMILLKLARETLFRRIMAGGIPAFFDEKDPEGSFEKLFSERSKYFEGIADLKIDCNGKSGRQIVDEILEKAGKV